MTLPNPSAVLKSIRETKPLVHNITNYVAMDLSANALLALGALPVMAHAPEEVEEMAALAQALVLNIGTLSSDWVESMKRAFSAAAKRSIPVVLDPVGAGATVFRTRTACDLIRSGQFSIIRGNASEICALSAAMHEGLSRAGATRGVDSMLKADAAIEAGRALAQSTGAIVVISGETDFVLDSGDGVKISNGHPIMTKVTALGCTASAVCGACLGLVSPLEAGVSAMAIMGVAAEMAVQKLKDQTLEPAPASFRTCFIDALALIKPEDLRERARIAGF